MSRKNWRRQGLNQGVALLISARGQTMPMAVVAVIVLVLLGACVVGLMAIFGGSNELQNAVDSGNLNVATMSVVGPEVQLNPQQVEQFAGVAVERNGKFYINLGNINRVWGQTMAVVLNAQMMDKENGQRVFSPEAQMHVRHIYSLATEISRDLTSKLNLPSTELSTAYKTLSGSNSLRMVGQSDPTLLGENWNTSFYEQMQKKDSNVYINTAQQFAAGAIQLPTQLFNPNRGYMLGYEPFFLNDPMQGRYDFCFIPLSHEQRPFLVPIQKFDLSKPTDFLAGFNLQGVIPPNSFSYLSKTEAPKTDNKLQKIAAGVAKDVTAGYPIQFPRGFIRIDNDPGVGQNFEPGLGLQGLHVIDHLSQIDVTPAYQALFGRSESPVLAETKFNPLQCKEGLYIPFSTYALRKFVVALGYGMLSMGIVFMKCGPPPLGPALIPWFFGCAMPIAMLNSLYPIYGPELVDDGGLKAAMGHTPAVSYGGPMLHNGQTREWFSVYASNANGSKLPLMLEGGNTGPIWLGIAAGEVVRHDFLQNQTIAFLPMDIDIYFAWMIANGMGPNYSSMLEYHPSDAITSGMRVRLTGNLPVPSLINLNSKRYVMDGGMKDFLGDRESIAVVNPLCAALRRRMRLIKPSATDNEMTQILKDTNAIPLGCSAFIFLGNDNNLKLGVARGASHIGGERFPSWLTRNFMYTKPDPREPWALARYEDTIPRSYYRLADPTRDFRSKTKGFSQEVSNDYPSTMQNFDDYIFRPASGFNGLLGALELRSGVKKVCALPGSNTKSGGWDMPENCFIDDPMYQGRYGPKE